MKIIALVILMLACTLKNNHDVHIIHSDLYKMQLNGPIKSVSIKYYYNREELNLPLPGHIQKYNFNKDGYLISYYNEHSSGSGFAEYSYKRYENCLTRIGILNFKYGPVADSVIIYKTNDTTTIEESYVCYRGQTWERHSQKRYTYDKNSRLLSTIENALIGSDTFETVEYVYTADIIITKKITSPSQHYHYTRQIIEKDKNSNRIFALEIDNESPYDTSFVTFEYEYYE